MKDERSGAVVSANDCVSLLADGALDQLSLTRVGVVGSSSAGPTSSTCCPRRFAWPRAVWWSWCSACSGSASSWR